METEYGENRKYPLSTQAKWDGYAWNVRNCMNYMKKKNKNRIYTVAA